MKLVLTAIGASLILATDADAAYLTLDANGLITLPSAIITRGPHASGAGPALDPTTQEPYVRKWLEMEAEERELSDDKEEEKSSYNGTSSGESESEDEKEKESKDPKEESDSEESSHEKID